MKPIHRTHVMRPRHTIRLIPRLDIKGDNLVKGVHLEGLRVLGKPDAFARLYYEHGADELMYQDVVASLYGRNGLTEMVTKTATQIAIPLTVGGGLRTMEDLRHMLCAGADKVAINTAAIARPEFITEAANALGSSTIVVAIEAIRGRDGRYLAYTDNGREHTGIDAIAWAEEAVARGAGELIVTSVDREGTGEGVDLALVSAIAAKVTVPVVAHGGVGTPEHSVTAVDAGADAICLASLLHYTEAARLFSSETESSAEGNTRFLSQSRTFGKFGRYSLRDVRRSMLDAGIPTRNSLDENTHV